MKFSKIGLAVNEIGRAREIVAIIVKYGLSEWVTTSGLGKFFVTKKRLRKIEQYNQWERIRLAIEELGPTFIKFGQILADRPDIIPEGLRDELKKLQDEAQPMPDEEAIREIEKELGRKTDELFREFDRNRLASASIAQTYRAVLLNGEEVCIKIQRPGIDKKIELDLHLMNFFAIRMQHNNPEMEAINLSGVVREFGKTIKKELDFHNEAANVIRFSHCFENDPDIRVPKVFSQYTTRRILVEEFINGTKIRDLDMLLKSGNDPKIIARKAVRLGFDQIFKHGFFHADPHPGNIFVLENNLLSFIDFGMMGTLRPEHLQFLGKYVLGYLDRDAHAMAEAMVMISGKRNFNRFRDLEFKISDMLAHYKYLSIDEMDFSRIMNESVDILVHYGLRIPPDIYLLVKSLMSIEGVAVLLCPEIDFAKEMQPYAIELVARQYNPKWIAREIFDSIKEYYKLIKDIPSDLNEIIYRLKEGRFKTQIEVKGLEPLINHIDGASSRMSVAIVLAALIIGASIISQWEKTHMFGTVVFGLAGILGFWLLIKLFKKNKF
ncbi:MAG: AarF/ABC1/UbiB kinase family protein [Alphaproteobacteria bacterium]|nr:AarF/ABC1/UbiB kinase family protein [Alphaproteobacteria bacterium]